MSSTMNKNDAPASEATPEDLIRYIKLLEEENKQAKEEKREAETLASAIQLSGEAFAATLSARVATLEEEMRLVKEDRARAWMGAVAMERAVLGLREVVEKAREVVRLGIAQGGAEGGLRRRLFELREKLERLP